MISIVIPLYNKEATIKASIASVLNQLFKDFEIIVVDDGSTDKSVEIVEHISDARVKLIRQVNSGVAAARNKGIDLAKGEWIAFLDADDLWTDTYLQSQVDLINKYPECSVVATAYYHKNSRGELFPIKLCKLCIDGELGVFDNYFEVASCSNPPIWTSAVMVKKEAIRGVGGFPVGIKAGEDLIVWAKLACKYKVAYNTKPLAIYVIDERLFNDDQKKRRPEKNDYVGRELYRLYNENPQVKGLRKYVSLWHKMRCRIFISKYERRLAILEGVKAIEYNVSVKNIVFLCLSFLPLNLSNKIINRLS